MTNLFLSILKFFQSPDWSDGVYHTVSDDEWCILIAEDEDYCSYGVGVGSVTIRYPF